MFKLLVKKMFHKHSAWFEIYCPAFGSKIRVGSLQHRQRYTLGRVMDDCVIYELNYAISLQRLT